MRLTWLVYYRWCKIKVSAKSFLCLPIKFGYRLSTKFDMKTKDVDEVALNIVFLLNILGLLVVVVFE